jgi:hypothetical protein
LEDRSQARPRIVCPEYDPQTWSHRLVVRTLASHAGNRGSSPRGTTNKENKGFGIVTEPFFYAYQIHFQPYFQPTDQKEPPVTEIDGIVAVRNVQVFELDPVELDQDVDLLCGARLGRKMGCEKTGR